MMVVILAGCVSSHGKQYVSGTYKTPDTEAQWIQDGMPIEYNGTLWYPVDDIESFRDQEMMQVGEHNGVPFFIDRIDIKPYNRLYTKFGRNKFRYYEPHK